MSELEPTCRELRPHLSAFVDAELDPAIARRVADHLAACPDCAADVAALREPGDLLDAAFGGVTAPAGAVLRVLRRIERSDVASPASRVATFALEAACAAAAVLLAALVFAVTHTERPARGATPDLEQILGQPADTPDSETPRSDSDLLATILADPGEVVFWDEGRRSR